VQRLYTMEGWKPQPHIVASRSMLRLITRPAAGVLQPIAAALALAARALTQSISIGLSSSRHCLEEHRDVEARRQEDALAACRRACAGVDLARTSYLFGGGCLAFTDALCHVTWPHKFHPGITFKYDGSTDPCDFLHVYTTTMEIAEGGDPHVMTN
jgi:hypothetical protein